MRGAEKFMLSLVRDVLSWQKCSALAAIGLWLGGRREIQTCRNLSAPPCNC